MQMVGRFAESEDAVLFARFSEVDKCEFIKINAPEDAWASTDDGAGLLVKVDALREQAREALVSTARFRTSSLQQPSHFCFSYLHIPLCVLDQATVAYILAATASGTTVALASAAALEHICD